MVALLRQCDPDGRYPLPITVECVGSGFNGSLVLFCRACEGTESASSKFSIRIPPFLRPTLKHQSSCRGRIIVTCLTKKDAPAIAREGHWHTTYTQKGILQGRAPGGRARCAAPASGRSSRVPRCTTQPGSCGRRPGCLRRPGLSSGPRRNPAGAQQWRLGRGGAHSAKSRHSQRPSGGVSVCAVGGEVGRGSEIRSSAAVGTARAAGGRGGSWGATRWRGGARWRRRGGWWGARRATRRRGGRTLWCCWRRSWGAGRPWTSWACGGCSRSPHVPTSPPTSLTSHPRPPRPTHVPHVPTSPPRPVAISDGAA